MLHLVDAEAAQIILLVVIAEIASSLILHYIYPFLYKVGIFANFFHTFFKILLHDLYILHKKIQRKRIQSAQVNSPDTFVQYALYQRSQKELESKMEELEQQTTTMIRKILCHALYYAVAYGFSLFALYKYRNRGLVTIHLFGGENMSVTVGIVAWLSLIKLCKK